MKMRTDDFDYDLPEALIAQYPAEQRRASRMLVLDRNTGLCEFRNFTDLPSYLNSGDAVIFNNTRVMNARMYGTKAETGAKIEILQVTPAKSSLPGNCWHCLLRPGKRVKIGTRVSLLTREDELSDISFTVISRSSDGLFTVRFSEADNRAIQKTCGHVPLPPYIKRHDETDDFERYQTVYAKVPGAVAAPTAGLHFSQAMIETIEQQKVQTAEVTLHVGPGTFKPVGTDYVQDHKMHEEVYEMSAETAALIDRTRSASGKVLAVGTTVVRVLESIAASGKGMHACSGSTDIFIYPPYQFRAVDMLLTNFHLPKSTLLMLVCAFAGKDQVMNAYRQAVAERFRFYSYGDCMLLV